MADELHSFLDILADVAKQQEEEEKNKTQKSGDTESEEKTADRLRSTTATNEKSANDKNIKPAPQQEKDDPDFFNSAISNVKKNSRNSKKRNNSGEISIFDQISKNRKTGNTARRSTTRRSSSARTGTAGRRRTSSRSTRIRVPSTNSIIKMILKALIDLIFGKKGKSTARKSSLSGTDVLNSLLNGNNANTSTVKQNNLSGHSTTAISQGLLESVVLTMFGNGRSSNVDHLPVFKHIAKSILESDNRNAFNDTASFKDTAAKLGYSSKESEDAAGILEGLLNSNLSNESIASVLELFTESEDD